MSGALPVHIGMLLAMVITLQVPSHCHQSSDFLNTPLSGKQTYWLLLSTHIIVIIQKFLYAYDIPDRWPTLKELVMRYNKRMRVFVNVLIIFTFSEISYSWVFVPWFHDESADCDSEQNAWQKFQFFMLVEAFVFIGNLFGAIVFMLFRANFHNQLMWDIEEYDKWEETDAITLNLE